MKAAADHVRLERAAGRYLSSRGEVMSSSGRPAGSTVVGWVPLLPPRFTAAVVLAVGWEVVGGEKRCRHVEAKLEKAEEDDWLIAGRWEALGPRDLQRMVGLPVHQAVEVLFLMASRRPLGRHVERIKKKDNRWNEWQSRITASRVLFSRFHHCHPGNDEGLEGWREGQGQGGVWRKMQGGAKYVTCVAVEEWRS